MVAIGIGGNEGHQAADAYTKAVGGLSHPFLGQTGFFTLSAIAALPSTTSVINATVYGAARLSSIIAKGGELLTL